MAKQWHDLTDEVRAQLVVGKEYLFERTTYKCWVSPARTEVKYIKWDGEDAFKQRVFADIAPAPKYKNGEQRWCRWLPVSKLNVWTYRLSGDRWEWRMTTCETCAMHEIGPPVTPPEEVERLLGECKRLEQENKKLRHLCDKYDEREVTLWLTLDQDGEFADVWAGDTPPRLSVGRHYTSVTPSTKRIARLGRPGDRTAFTIKLGDLNDAC